VFIDEVEIVARSGNGGAGSVSFLREKYKPNCGPDGGDGGDGADIYILATTKLNTLASFRFKRKFFAKNGEPGKGKNMYGKNAEDLIIEVPVGTAIYSEGKLISDLHEDGQKRMLLKGGKGGKGNVHFASPTRQTPRYAQPGVPGEDATFKLELRVLADIGLLGLPNAGKSTLLSSLTNARPKIAAYPFTTLSPSLGVLKSDSRELVIADIPGIIEGAHDGIGLGITFLKHIERTILLLHLVDAISENIEDDITVILNELKSYSVKLLDKKRILVFNKIDSIPAERIAELQNKFPEALFISAVSKENLDDLVIRLLQEA